MQAQSAAAAPVKKVYIIAALMLAISLAALDSTIVGTAAPTIAGKLGGLSLFSWVFSVYLLTSTVTVPLYGKLADLYGRKPILIFGCVMFLAGSALCGTAGSMEQLIFFRAIQGLGAGAVQPITMTIIGDIFTIEERAKIQGLFSSVWGVTALAGPALGGLVTEGMSWRWVFLANVPFGLATIFLVLRYFKETTQKQSHVIDYWGSVLLSGSVVALLLGLLQSVDSYGWTGTPTLSLLGLSALLMGIFLRQELRAAEPIVPLWLFRNPVIAIGSLTTFMGGGLMFGVSSYVPLFSQGVFGGTAINAGLIVLPMSISWPLGSIVGGRIILKVGYYLSAICGTFCLILGSLTLLALSKESGQGVAMASVTIIGFGMGLTTSAVIISVQNAVEWRHRGVATASTQFFRTIGGSIAVAIMGAILNTQMSSRLGAIEGVPSGASENTLLTPEARSLLPEGVLSAMQQALSASLHEVFFCVLIAAVISFGVVWFFPRGRAHDLAHGAAGERGPEREPEARGLASPETFGG
jgi:EmrB/QacA subfamily drug resistance transporter